MSEQAQGGTPVTMEAIQKMINDGIAAGVANAMKPVNDTLGNLQKGLAANAKQVDAANVRRQFLETNMKGVPRIYQEKMPETGDTAELLQAEQTIRKMLRDDYKAAGFKVPDVGGGNPGGYTNSAPPPPRVDILSIKGNGEKTPSELIGEGLRLADKSH